MGAPIASTSLEGGGRLDIYAYELGNAPSAGRAVGHAVMDVLTLGILGDRRDPYRGVPGGTPSARRPLWPG